MIEIVEKRRENSKTFDLSGGKRQWRGSIGAIHYKDDYTDKSEQWKDIDLTWEGNRITQAPFEVTLEGNRATIRDKKTGEISSIELLDIGGQAVPAFAWTYSKGLAKAGDIEVRVDNGHIRFGRILRNAQAPTTTRFKIKGKFKSLARDVDTDTPAGELPVETTVKNGILTETLKADRKIKYPVRIDPTWQVTASTDDVFRRLQKSGLWQMTTVQALSGYHDLSNYAYGNGFRFQSVAIGNGDTIDAAKLTLQCRTARAITNCNTRISAEDVDDPATFADDAGTFDTRWAARTTARVDWDNIEAWVQDSDYNSPEIKTVIQEIVDRGGWATGQDMVIFWEDFEDRSSHTNQYATRDAKSWDGDSSNCPILDITYTAAGAIATPSTINLITSEAQATLGIAQSASTTDLKIGKQTPYYDRGHLPSTLSLNISFETPTTSRDFITQELILKLTPITPTLLRTHHTTTIYLKTNLLIPSLTKGASVPTISLETGGQTSNLGIRLNIPALDLRVDLKEVDLQYGLLTLQLATALLTLRIFDPKIFSGVFPITITGRYGIEPSVSWEGILTETGRYGVRPSVSDEGTITTSGRYGND